MSRGGVGEEHGEGAGKPGRAAGAWRAAFCWQVAGKKGSGQRLCLAMALTGRWEGGHRLL